MYFKAISSPEKSMLKSKPSGILKKAKASEDETAILAEHENKIHRENFEEIFFNVSDKSADSIQITIHQGEDQKIIAMSTLSLEEMKEQKLTIKYIEENMLPEAEEAVESVLEEELSKQNLTSIPMQGVTLGIGGHSPGVLGDLSMLCYWIKKKKEKTISVETNTIDFKELIEDITGVNIDDISKEELMQILGREYNDMATSAMSVASSSSHKSGFIPLTELEVIREQHDLELKSIQDEYELKVQQLLMEIDKMQTLQMQQAMNVAEVPDPGLVQTSFLKSQEEASGFHRPPIHGEQQVNIGHRRVPRYPNLPKWGAHLPKDVWERMKLLTEEMMMKKKQLDARLRYQISSNIEKKLASQYRLQRTETGISGPLQDVSLPALFMPSRTGHVYNPRARLYFHPIGAPSDLRLTQPPSIFQLPPLPERAKMSVVNLFELSKNFEQPVASDWLNKMATAPSRSSRATTAGSHITPHTPAPTANVQSSDVYT